MHELTAYASPIRSRQLTLGRLAARWLVALAAVLVSGAAAQPAEAQLFGERTLGRPLSSQSAGQTSLLGESRFGTMGIDRPARDATSFVGRSPRGRETFVGRSVGVAPGSPVGALNAGSADAAQRIRAAEARRRSRPNANVLQIQRTAQSQSRIYRPRLVIDFDVAQQTDEENRRAETSISRALDMPELSGVSVSVRQGVATLRGVADALEAKRLAEIAAGMEPGVASVDNQLEIKSPLENADEKK